MSERVLDKHDAYHLLEHWIEHNESHSRSFRARATQLESISPEGAKAVEEAAVLMDQCTAALRRALESLGGH